MRIRNIKPEFWRSEDIKRLSREDRLLFVGLWSYVDDNGVGIDDYRQIAADLFPIEDDPVEVREFVQEGLQRISRGSLCTRYQFNGKAFIYINGWPRHQKVHNPNKPRYPLPNGEVAFPASDYVVSPETLGTASGDSPETLGTGSGGQGVRGSEGQEETSAEPPSRDDVESLCVLLRECVIANDVKAPTITEKWRTEARLLLDRDGRPLDQARRLIEWATSNSFWKSNILSMPKFRQQYDQLLLQARREHEQKRAPTNGHVPYRNPTDQSVYEESLL